MGNYISVADVKGKAIERPLQRAGWSDADIEPLINEAENYIEAALLGIGFIRQQLQTCPLVKNLCILYARYGILRDIYTDIAPSQSAGEGYKKWREDVDATLEKIISGEMRLYDTQGNAITPAGGDKRYLVETNTENVIRAIRVGKSQNWTIDTSYSDDDVIGKGGNEG